MERQIFVGDSSEDQDKITEKSELSVSPPEIVVDSETGDSAIQTVHMDGLKEEYAEIDEAAIEIIRRDLLVSGEKNLENQDKSQSPISEFSDEKKMGPYKPSELLRAYPETITKRRIQDAVKYHKSGNELIELGNESFNIPIPEYNVTLSVVIRQAKKKTEGPTKNILQIHGMRQDAYTFRELDRNLDEYNIISVNLPGFGGSDKLAPEDRHIKVYTDILEKFIREKIGDENLYAVIGNSLGSVLLAEILKRGVEPEKAILNGLPAGGISEAKALGRQHNAIVFTLYNTILSKLPSALQIALSRKQRENIVDPSYIDRRYMRSVNSADKWTATDLSEQLSHVDYTDGIKTGGRTEILFTGGNKDAYVAESDLQKTAAATPNSKLKVFAGGKHEQFRHDPEHFTGAVLDFLKKTA